MGHYVRTMSDYFDGVSYNSKSSAEVREAMTRKLGELRGYIATREQRTLKLREEYGIGPELLAQLIMQFQRDNNRFTNYNNQSGEQVIPAGVIANIIREQEMIDSERGQLRKLELVLRNLRDTEAYFEPRTGEHRERVCIHTLDDEELEYLGF